MTGKFEITTEPDENSTPIEICPALIGATCPIFYQGVAYISPAMYDLLHHATTDEELAYLSEHMQPEEAEYFDYESGTWIPKEN